MKNYFSRQGPEYFLVKKEGISQRDIRTMRGKTRAIQLTMTGPHPLKEVEDDLKRPSKGNLVLKLVGTEELL